MISETVAVMILFILLYGATIVFQYDNSDLFVHRWFYMVCVFIIDDFLDEDNKILT